MNGVMNGKEQDNINIAYNASNSVNAENSLPDSQPLPPPIDASVEVIITPDCLEAYLYVNPPANGGALLSLQMYQDALKAAKVTYGIIANKLEYLVAHSLYNERILIAKGYPPVASKDGTYELKFRAVKDLRPKVREDGSVDFRDLGIVENVKKNQLLCVITPPTDGEEGMTVTGKKLLPIKGSPVPSLLGKNVEIGPDGVSIYSQIDGQVDFINEKIYVNETFVIFP